MKNQIARATTANIRGITPFLPIASRNDGVVTGRQLNVNQRAGLTQGQHGLPLGFVDDHIDIGDVFVFRSDSKRHVQVVASSLLDSLRLILANSAGEIGNPVLLLPLNLHA